MEFPRLRALFSSYQERLRELEAADPSGWMLSVAERLLEDAAGLGVEGVEKVRCVGGVAKLTGLCSELRVANLFARLGFEVVLLRDEHYGPGVYAPDLEVRRGALEALVEVFQASDGSPQVTGAIDDALKSAQLPFRVEVHLGPTLSGARITYQERESTEATVEQLVEQLIVHLKSVDPGSRGKFTVDGHHFEYGPSPLADGYVGGSMSTVHWVRSDDHGRRLARGLERKALKQPRLPPDKQATPFILAYDNRENELSATEILSTIAGARCASARVNENETHLFEV